MRSIIHLAGIVVAASIAATTLWLFELVRGQGSAREVRQSLQEELESMLAESSLRGPRATR